MIAIVTLNQFLLVTITCKDARWILIFDNIMVVVVKSGLWSQA